MPKPRELSKRHVIGATLAGWYDGFKSFFKGHYYLLSMFSQKIHEELMPKTLQKVEGIFS
jgi:hypothetical protein